MNRLDLIIDALENSEPTGTGWVHVHEQKHQAALTAARELRDAQWGNPKYLIEEAVLAEREACAKLCDEEADQSSSDHEAGGMYWCAEAIRARSNPDRCDAVEAARLEEREACAALVEGGNHVHPKAPDAVWAKTVAKLIRQRGKK